MQKKGPLIVQPGTPRWVRPFIDPSELSGATGVAALALLLAFMVGVIGVVAGPLGIRLLGSAIVAGLVALCIAGTVGATRRSVDPTTWTWKGKPIVGESRRLLADAVIRAHAVEEFVAEIPARLDWKQFRPHVEALLWDAAEHAAEVCQLNQQLNQLRYAEAGTPQGDLKDDLLHRRADHLVVVAGARHQVEELAATAGNAAAAARLALQHTGSVVDLDVVSPSAPALIAQGGLNEAQTQLRLLSDAWAEVDASQRGVSASAELPTARAHRSPPPTGRQQEG